MFNQINEGYLWEIVWQIVDIIIFIGLFCLGLKSFKNDKDRNRWYKNKIFNFITMVVSLFLVTINSISLYNTIIEVFTPINHFTDVSEFEIFDIRTRCNVNYETFRCVNNEVKFNYFTDDELLQALKNNDTRRVRGYGSFSPQNDKIEISYLNDITVGISTIVIDLELPRVEIFMFGAWSEFVYQIIEPEIFLNELLQIQY